MAPEKTDQGQTKTAETPLVKGDQSAGIDWEGGFKAMDEMELLAKSEPKKTEAKPQAEETEPCDECPGGKREKETRTPFKVLKVQGRDVPVYSEQEFEALAMKGLDYTKKTQALSEERKQSEGEIGKRIDEIRAVADKIETIFGGLQGKQPIPKDEDISLRRDTEADVYEDYGIAKEDMEYLEPYQKKMIVENASLRKAINANEEKTRKMESIIQALILDKSISKIGPWVEEARQKYPIEDIKNEKGENLTRVQFATLLTGKMQADQNRDFREAIHETIREIHLLQQGSKATAAPDISENLSPDELRAKYPKLYERIAEHLKDQNIADYEAEKKNLPPSLQTKRTEVDTSTKKGKGDFDSISDAIDKAFSDTEILSALSGG